MFTSEEETKKTSKSMNWITRRCATFVAEMVMETLLYHHLRHLQIPILTTEVRRFDSMAPSF